MMINHWTEDVENMLLKLRLNSLLRSKYHKQSYFRMNAMLKYFRIPMIIFSALVSVFSMGDFYLKSYICATLGLLISIISSVELFLQIQKRMEIDLHNSKAFSTLAVDITKVVNLQKENRNIDGLKFLDDKMNEYNSLVDMSIVADTKLHDILLGVNLIHNISKDGELKLLTNGNIQDYIRENASNMLRASTPPLPTILTTAPIYSIDIEDDISSVPPPPGITRRNSKNLMENIRISRDIENNNNSPTNEDRESEPTKSV